MLRYFAKRNRAALVQEVFRKYLRAARKFWNVAARCATEGSPDQKVALQKAIRLQLVLIDRRASRFACLQKQDTFDWTHPGSIDSINERLDKGWGENEEASLLETNSFYRNIVREVEDIKANWDDSKLLEESILELGNNAKWRHAREVMADRVVELDNQLRQD
jgi:hypothetical protein